SGSGIQIRLIRRAVPSRRVRGHPPGHPGPLAAPRNPRDPRDSGERPALAWRPWTMSLPSRSRPAPRLRDDKRRPSPARRWAGPAKRGATATPTPDEVGRLALRRRMVATVVIAVVAFIPLDLI